MIINIPQIDFGTKIYSYDPTDGYKNVQCVNSIIFDNDHNILLCEEPYDGEICELSIFEQEIPYEENSGLYFFVDKNKFTEFKKYTQNINKNVIKEKYDQFFKKENKDDYFEKKL